MSEFPKQFQFPDPLVNLHTYSMASVGSMDTRAGSTVSTAWPSANTAIFIPFRITRPMTFSTLFLMNGAAVSGNVDMGVFSADGTRLVSAGSTPQAGTATIQTLSVPTTQIGAGQFYIALVFDNTTSTVYSQIFSVTAAAALMAVVGLTQMTTAFPLPSSATFATMSNNILPLVGISSRSFI